ncbi:hypothetical protein [Actinomadura macrotermitis]|uniref:hypothetical protein n=1 Tax=Actinomadura macrotermitis TaxID=2585200 RepID=UPI0012976979|nr:hypothetical protein [Actinomadura macrotermitis]
MAFALMAAAPAMAAPDPAATSTPVPAGVFRAALASPAALVPGAAHADAWWTFEPGKGRVYALGADGRTTAAFTAPGVPRVSALAVARGDGGGGTLVFGDLEGAKDTVTLYRAAEPANLAGGKLAVKAYKVRFPDGVHNGGVLAADPAEGRVYLITRGTNAAGVYALPAALGQQADNRLTRVRRLPFAVRGAAFTPDGRLVLRTPDAVRVLGGVRDRVTHVLRFTGSGAAFGVTADGRRALVADAGARPRLRAVALPGASRQASRDPQEPAPAPVPLADRQPQPIDLPERSGLPGGLLGTGALAGLVLLGVLGGVSYLHGRRHGG